MVMLFLSAGLPKKENVTVVGCIYKDLGFGGSVVMYFLDKLETKYPVNDVCIYVDNYVISTYWDGG